jgi:hypothetical protein
VGVAATYSGLILWTLFLRLDSLRFPLKTYGDVAERIYGKYARHLCNVLQFLQLIINVSTLYQNDNALDDVGIFSSGWPYLSFERTSVIPD